MKETRFRQLLHQILKRSRRNEVEWRLDQSSRNNNYYVKFDSYRLEIALVTPDTESDFIRCALVAENGWNVVYMDAESSDEDWELFSELLAEAERHVTKWDAILDDLERQANAPGKLGADPLPEDEEDIPF